MREPKFIETPLQIVYRKGNDLFIKRGVDEDNKNFIWGFYFPNGVMVSKDYYGNLSSSKARELANELTFEHKKGSLPKGKQMEYMVKHYGCADDYRTIRILRRKGIDTNLRIGYCWCKDVLDNRPESNCFFDSFSNTICWTDEVEFDWINLAVVFE